MFSCFSNTIGEVKSLSDVGVSHELNITPLNRMQIWNSVRISLSTWSQPNFYSQTQVLWSSNMTDPVRILADVRVALRYHGSIAYMHSNTSFHVNCLLFATIFDLWLTLTTDITCTCLLVLLNSENMSQTVEILLLSFIPAEICVIVHVLPVNGSHVWFTSHTEVKEY